MTNDEAIAYFKRHIDLYCVDGICREAEETAIKALEQQPCDDAISRQAVLDRIRESVPDRDRNRGSDNGQPQQMDPEEVTAVLYLLRIRASSREKQVIDYLIDKEERENNEEQNQA